MQMSVLTCFYKCVYVYFLEIYKSCCQSFHRFVHLYRNHCTELVASNETCTTRIGNVFSYAIAVRLYSSVVERQSCKLKVLGSIPSGGFSVGSQYRFLTYTVRVAVWIRKQA